MKRFTKLLLIISMLILLGIPARAATPEEISALETLITRGNNITDPATADAYVWVNDVNTFNNSYTNSSVYSSVKSLCSDAKSYSSISTFNTNKRIIGHLMQLKDELSGTVPDTVSSLITRGGTVSAQEPDAYKWVLDVLKTIEQYNGSAVYSYLKQTCKDTVGYSSITTFNSNNKLIGALKYLSDENASTNTYGINPLITEGNNLTNDAAPEAYYWVFKVRKLNNDNSETSVYQSLNSKCSDAIGYSSISTFNTKQQILADLMTAKDEIPVSSVLNGITVTTDPVKITYNEDENFSPAGMVVTASFFNTYSDNQTKTVRRVVTDYTVDTTTPLKSSDTQWLVSYISGGVTKTAYVSITVNPYEVLRYLESISLVYSPSKTTYYEGECFSSTGARIDATYTILMSDQTRKTETTSNVQFNVSNTNPLTQADTSVKLSVTYNNVTREVSVPISVIAMNGDLPEQQENNQGQNQNGENESGKTEEPDSPQKEEIHNGDAVIIDGSEYIVNTKKKTVVLNESAEKSNYSIPAVITIYKETYKVVGIADRAFEENEVIKKIKGGENLESIGAAAFYRCINLTEVDLSKTKVKSIKTKTFKDCPKLKKLTINGTYLKSFGRGSLSNTKQKMKIYIKEATNKQYKSLSKKIKKAGNKTVVIKKK